MAKNQYGRTKTSPRWVFYLPIIGMSCATFLLFVNDIYFIISGQRIPILPVVEYRDKINIVLTLAIALFAAVEAYSTYLQVLSADKRNRIEDLRNELERAYGPLYTLLNKKPLGEPPPKEYLLSSQEKAYLDEIVATHSFVFSSELYNLWLEEIQPLQPKFVSARDPSVRQYNIPLEFIDKVNDEYHRKVKEYYRLLKKD